MGAFGYPVSLEVRGRRCVVIGEGAVRAGKAQALEDAGADVVVLADGAWRPQDLDGALICVASSGDPVERSAIAREARRRGVLVNVIDDVPNCDFAAPAVVRRGDLLFAVSTGGASPALARKLRQELAARFGPEWAELVDVLREVRERTLPLLPDLAERSLRWARALDPDEAAALIRDGRRAELETRLLRRLAGEEAVA